MAYVPTEKRAAYFRLVVSIKGKEKKSKKQKKKFTKSAQKMGRTVIYFPVTIYELQKLCLACYKA